jgi:dCTP deaminase
MIGSDELVRMLADRRSSFSVTPLIDAADQIGEGSIDIRLGPDVIVSPRATGATAFDPTNAETFKHDLEQRQQYIRRGIGDPFQLQPGEFAIARSLEYVSLPSDISAEALGRSSWGRLGLVIATATLIQPGFKGTITLELANVGDTSIMLEVGLSIAQLIFSRQDGRVRRPRRELLARRRMLERRRVRAWRRVHRQRNTESGRYSLQIKPALSQLHRDKDLLWLTPFAVRYVVGFVGERFAGTSTAIGFLISRHHFRLYRLNQFASEEARRRGLDAANEKVVATLTAELREEHGPAILAQLAFQRIRDDLLDPGRRNNLVPVVIDDFQTREEIEVWQRLDLFRSVVVGAPLRMRRERGVRSGVLQMQAPGYPRDATPDEQDGWFRQNVDEVPAMVPARAAIGAAREHPRCITVDNGMDGPLHLPGGLQTMVGDLERWWRRREY